MVILKCLEECNTLRNCKVEGHFYKPQHNFEHLVRHVKFCVESLFAEADRLFSPIKFEIELHEWLFNMEFGALWTCESHASHARHVNACHKWIQWLESHIMDKLESIRYVLWDILHHLFPRDSWDDDAIPLKSCLEDLDRYMDAFREMIQIVAFIKQISDGNYVKRHKNYMLRQLWKRARSNSLVEWELKRGYGPFQWQLRANLSLFKMLQETKNTVRYWIRTELDEAKDKDLPFENIDFLINWEYFWKGVWNE